MKVKIAPSILASDLSRLGEEVREAIAAGADFIHVDIMDGHFVPNITFGPVIVAAISTIARKGGVPLDVHLMVKHPERFIADFVSAGADILTVHVETCPHLHRTIQMIKENGIRAGVTLNPATTLDTIDEILPDVDLVLIMSVNPGFGGQSYIPGSTEKITRLRAKLQQRALSQIELEVDGGISASNAAEIVKAGASILVAGSSIFNKNASISDNIKSIRFTCK